MYREQEKHTFKKVPHGLRHKHCSLLFETDASIKEVQDCLVHTDVKTTMDIYSRNTKGKRRCNSKFVNYWKAKLFKIKKMQKPYHIKGFDIC